MIKSTKEHKETWHPNFGGVLVIWLVLVLILVWIIGSADVNEQQSDPHCDCTLG